MYEKEFQDYSNNIKLKLEDSTEHTFRGDIENLLNAIKPDDSFLIINEGKKDIESIANRKPDLRIRKSGLIIGYIETKPLDTDLDSIINGTARHDSEQFQDYLEQLSSFILTDYSVFIRFKDGEELERLRILDENNEIINDEVEHLLELFDSFFSVFPDPIKTPKKLAHLLAKKAHRFKENLTDYIKSEENDEFKTILIGEGGLFDIYKDFLIENLDQNKFMDAYVQTIIYGLFLARLNTDDTLTIEDAWKNIPKSVGVIRELFETIKLEIIPIELSWIIDEVITYLNSVDEVEFKENLSFSNSHEDSDPYIYFYENFLTEYNPTERKLKGVYYTPIPIVDFIVKSTDHIIKNMFDKDGLKDSDVTVLDFATGTGTFLREAFNRILSVVDEGMKNSIIRERLLKNFYGFEILIAPYTISHLRLSQYLKEVGYDLDDDERLNVYLADTLDNTEHTLYSYFHKISLEGKEANEIKLKKNILAIIGNPPYSNFTDGSESRSREWINELLEEYKRGSGETKLNLNDDYIKFLRYAQWKINENGYGIIGVITNNSFIDGVTHKIMRKSLLETFDEIYILNLHGHYRTDPIEDKNVFDIRMGVCISFFIKLEEPSSNKKIRYYSTRDNGIITREEKYDLLLNNSISEIEWVELEPNEPSYYFFETDLELEDEYNTGWSLIDIFNEYGSGFKTERDSINIHFTKKELIDVLNDFNSLSEAEIATKYDTYDSRDWSILRAKDDVSTNFSEYGEELIKNASYRPFDDRIVYYSGQSRGFMGTPQRKIGTLLIDEKNLGLVSVRQVAENKGFNHVFITEKLADIRMMSSSRGTCYVFPLYLDTEAESTKQTSLTSEISSIESYNLNYPNNNFTDDFKNYITEAYSQIPSPKEILGYIYCILHSRAYREKFNFFLKTDYPKIQFPDNFKQFEVLSEIGSQLIDIHLLNSDLYEEEFLKEEFAKYPVDGDNLINNVTYDEERQHIYINDSQYFDNIPNNIWNIQIGGYNVLKKWLDYRKGRKLLIDDIEHVQDVTKALYQTNKIMDDIDLILY